MYESNIPNSSVGNNIYFGLNIEGTGSTWVTDNQGKNVKVGQNYDSELELVNNQINLLNTYIGRLGVEKVSAQNGGDTNLIKETGIRFVFNVEHLPSGYSYGMLETFKLESGGFSPSNEGVCVQRFTDWYSGYTFTRTYRQMSWGEWNCPDAKIETLQEQITAISNMLMETANLEQE